MTHSAARPVLITDSSCDLPAPLAAELGLTVLRLSFTINGEEHVDDLGLTMPNAEFYRRMRAGAVPMTSAVPLAEYLEAFTRCAEEGRPALLLGLSRSLSSSYEAALSAAETVRGAHPDADLRLPDTVNASASLGILVLEAAKRLAQGAGIDELERWVLDNRLRVNGYFTLDTLEYLRRGGRIHDIVAYAGKMLDVRPLLRIDAKGDLVLTGQARGRRKSMRALVDVVEKRVEEPEGQTPLVAHGDSLDDAEALREMLLERVPFPDAMVTELGPVMGAHAGPGMLAITFFGRTR